MPLPCCYLRLNADLAESNPVMDGTVMTIIELSGERVLGYLDQLAGLRLSIFQEYPYLYDGRLEDERRYLGGYADHGQVLLAVDSGRVVGAITGMPLVEESELLVEPFRAAGLAPERGYYIGELLFLQRWRHRGWGSRLLARLEELIRLQGDYSYCCFVTVIRPPDHPLQPVGFVPIESFCQHQGYRRLNNTMAQLAWREVDGQVSNKRLACWYKKFLA